MAVTNGGMTLYTDNDTQQSWAGSNDLDTEVYVQGTGSESWLVGKNSTETSTLTLSAAMGTPKYFTFYMKSDWGSFYNTITASLSDGTSVNVFTVATGGKNAIPNATPEISGDFKSSVLQIDQGTVPAYVPNNHTAMEITVDASTTGNIRSITNHWIDCMYYGSGRTISGTTEGDKIFEESSLLDVSSDTFDGLSTIIGGVVFFQSDVLITTTTGNCFGETVVFREALNTDNLYNLEITGTASFVNSAISGSGATVAIDATAATSFGMTGGSVTGGSTISFASGQTISGTVFNSCGAIDSNGATLSNITIGSTTATTATGSLVGNTPAEIALMDNITFDTYTGKYALYIPATNLGPIDLDGYSFDASGTDIYWAGTTGTLVVNLLNGSNATVTATAGGTISLVVAPVTTLITVRDIVTNTVIEGARVLLTAAEGGPLTAGTVIFNELTDVNGQVSDTRSLATDQPVTGRVRKASGAPFYKNVPISESINSTTGLSLNVAMIPDQ